MSYLVLARKYRPQRFADVIEQEHITRTLGNALAAGRVAHALLFAGPRGTGKTTVARILAKALNCRAASSAAPCNACRSCQDITAGHAVDVYEIDGASNNSVDQIRELRENVKYMPAHSPYKIYIIDEVHMLSTPAFNALLKTLEEPPAHVIFMFATTEAHKIPITILSRCQRFDFRRVRVSAIAGYLAAICLREEIEIDTASLDLIARESGGSVRDSLSLLDQVIACGQKKIPHSQILETLGVIDRSQLRQLADALLVGEPLPFLSSLDELFDRGHDIKKLFSDLLEYFRDLWVIQTTPEPRKAVDLPADEIDLLQAQIRQVSSATLQQILDILYGEETAVRLSPQPKLALEMAFFRSLHARTALSIDTLIRKVDDLRREIGGSEAGCSPFVRGASPHADAVRPAAAPDRSDDRPQVDAPPSPAETIRERGGSASAADSQSGLTAAWQDVAQTVSHSYPSLGANLRKCSLRHADSHRVEIVAPANQFLSSMLRRDKHLSLIRKVCAEKFGGQPEVTVIAVDESGVSSTERRDRNHTQVKETLNHPVVADAIEIFNGKLVDVQIRQEVDK
ncbi:MAG: DNA polymerase III subunit gamma/tau [Desulfobacterales bacterium]|jgi:DNA polymerase-3 subunit gamma/tau|nr:DNA polymerase III subunit gamma/tau [Desulfobacterales bacterium]